MVGGGVVVDIATDVSHASVSIDLLYIATLSSGDGLRYKMTNRDYRGFKSQDRLIIMETP